MPLNVDVDERTHEVLAEELSEYDRQAAIEEAEEWADKAPAPEQDARNHGTVFEIYQDQSGTYRWRLVTDEGAILAEAGRGFDELEAARTAAERLQDSIGTAPVVTLET